MPHLCDMCKKSPATIHLTDIHNDVKHEAHLCAACAAKKNFTVEALKNLPQFLGGLAKAKLEQVKKASAPRKPAEPDLVCEECGLGWTGFRAKGRLGCAHDYTAFRERLTALLSDAQGGHTRHAGKRPLRDTETRTRVREARLRELRRRRLEKELQTAVKDERYEEAGRLRDEIARLESAAASEAPPPDAP